MEHRPEENKVLRLQNRKSMAAGNIAIAVIIAMIALLISLLHANGTLNQIAKGLLAFFFAFFALFFIMISVNCLRSKIVLEEDRFVYCDMLGRMHEYSFDEAASCCKIRSRYNPNPPLYYLRMNDRRVIRVDTQMLKDGLGEAIGFDFWHDRLKKEL